MATGPMQFGTVNNAGASDTVLRSQQGHATLDVINEPAAVGLTAGPGLTVTGGPFGLKATAGEYSDVSAVGVHGLGVATTDIGVKGEGGTGVFGKSGVDNGTGVKGEGDTGVSGKSVGAGNGVQGVCDSYNASGVYGENNAGGWGVAGRTYGFLNGDRAAVLGESLRDPSTDANSPNGKAAGVYGYSETGYGGVFISGQAGSNVPWVDSGGLRVVGPIVKTNGEYSEALPHPDGSLRLMYAPLSPESWYEDVGRAELIEGRAEVELDAEFAALLGIDADSYHVFLTPEGETNGLYVSLRTARAFTVREQQGGTSNAAFSYRVMTKNKHRQPNRLAKFEESNELTKRPRDPSRLPSGRPGSSV